MVARPTDIPSWATDANFPAGTDPWSGTPTRIEPDAGDQAAGFEPKAEPPAQWANWLWGLLSDWIGYLGTPIASRVMFIPATGTVNSGDTWLIDNVSGMSAQTSQVPLYIDVGHWLPDGATLKEVHLAAKPSTARTGTDRINMGVYKKQLDTWPGSDPSSVQLGSTQYDDGTTAAQLLSVTGLSEVIDKTTRVYGLFIVTALTPTYPPGDIFRSVKLVFDDPGTARL